MKKLCSIVVFSAIMLAMPNVSYGRGGHYGPPPGPGSRMHHPHHYSAWGRGGSHFWPGFVGGLIGSTICPPPSPVVVAPAPVVVQQPAPVVVAPAPVVAPVPVVVPTRPAVYRAW